ncbi:MAG: hypothetical protein ACYDEX_21360 [Mobilitalea sp.]
MVIKIIKNALFLNVIFHKKKGFLKTYKILTKGRIIHNNHINRLKLLK